MKPPIPPLPHDGHELPRDSFVDVEHDRVVREAAITVALRHDAAVTAWFLRRLERRLA